MKMLALDASTEALSVAVHDSAQPQTAREHFEIAPRAHATRLLPLAQQLLADQGWSLTQLDGLAFGRGPGAFTGLRIAAGLVQGLAYGVHLPVVPVSTLQALAARTLARHACTHVQVVQDARMGEIYAAEYRHQSGRVACIGAERVLAPSGLEIFHREGWRHAGNGWPVVATAGAQALPAVAEQWPHAADMAAIGCVALAVGAGVDAAQALPSYVRDEVARKPSRI